MDTGAFVPDKSVRRAAYFQEPNDMRYPQVDGTYRPARSLSPQSLAARHAKFTPPSAQSTLDSDVIRLSDSLSNQSSEQSIQTLDTLRSSNIVEKGANDERSRFWTVYQKVVSQHDNEFLEQYDGDMDIVLIFAECADHHNCYRLLGSQPEVQMPLLEGLTYDAIVEQRRD
ncbi:hypothetical protein BDR06DRAFT_1009400 [Suillus hirtellus]|nr:hypothetical protein BDR06DRAFT_1009400 [Suillus hirtellus]